MKSPRTTLGAGVNYVMKRIFRDPMRFDGFELFAKYAAQQKCSISEPKHLQSFLADFKKTIEQTLVTKAHLYGRRTENLFETIVAGLGKVVLLKQEDQGDLYFSENHEVALPDFRAVLENNTQLLIEVKNHYQEKGSEPLVFKTEYLERLEHYGKLMGCEVLAAVYWHAWNMWTLVSLTTFKRGPEEASLDIGDAFGNNRMSDLGDVWLGTKPPLVLQIETDETNREGDIRSLTIHNTKMFSGGVEVTEPAERRIAFALMLYGRWEGSEPTPVMKDGKVVAIEYEFSPAQEQRMRIASGKQQEFDMVEYLSGIISQMFRAATSDDAGLIGTRVPFSPGEYGNLVPQGYKGKSLLLWQLSMQPKKTPDKA